MRLLLPILTVIACGAFATAQIERLTLQQMVEKTDGAVRGEIIGREVHRVAHPIPDSGDLFFTTLMVSGTSLVDGAAATVSVSYPGGYLDARNGAWNSEAPTDAETATGKDVVVFYKWSDDMGGGFASNALYASHGGVYGVFEARRGGLIVQGRGEGYAVERNVKLDELTRNVAELARKKQQDEKK